MQKMYLTIAIGLIIVACTEKPQECTAKGMNDTANKQVQVSDSINRLIERNTKLKDSYFELAELDPKYLDTLQILESERKRLLVTLDNAVAKADKESKALQKKCIEFN